MEPSVSIVRSLKRSDFQAVKALSKPLYSQYTDPAFPLDDASCLKMLNTFYQTPNSYFKGLFEDGRLQSWMFCSPGHYYHHSFITGMSQLYYHTKLQGIKAVKALVLMHEDYFNFVQDNKFQIAVTSSYLPTASTFSRILMRHGWRETDAGRLVKLTKFHPALTEVEGVAAAGAVLSPTRPRPDALAETQTQRETLA